jgi:SAM-dependent methyltransferase
MDYNEINWGKLWEDAMKNATGAASWSSSGSKRGLKRWDEGAKILNDHLDYHLKFMKDDEYANKFVSLMEFDSDSTILDVGCGGGILTIPLAKKVKQVTALDVSEVRINQVKEKAKLEGLSNIKFVCKDWSTASLENDIGKHDIVIASRSLGMCNLLDELKKIDSAAIERVYISRNTISVDKIRIELHRIIGLKYNDLPSYIYVLNMLCQMGILANVKFIACQRKEYYRDLEQAVKVWMWRLGNPVSFKEQIRQHLIENLIPNNQGGLSTVPSEEKWAVMFWKKQQLEG